MNNQENTYQDHNKLRRNFILYLEEVLISLGVIGILVPIIVDISINQKFTWSLIVTISILYAYSGLCVHLFSKKAKCMKALATYSILLIPFLYGLESLVDHFYLVPSQNRFFEYALPISVLWLAIVWGTVLIGTLTKMNLLYRFGILSLLSILGSTVTNAIAYKITCLEAMKDITQMIEIVTYIGLAVFFFVVGTFRKVNKRIVEQ